MMEQRFCFRILVLSALITDACVALDIRLLEDVMDALTSSTIFGTNLVPRLCGVRHALITSRCADDGHLSPAPYVFIERSEGQLGSVRIKVRSIELERVDWENEHETWMDANDDAIKNGAQWGSNSTTRNTWRPSLNDITLEGKAIVDVSTALGDWRSVDVNVTWCIKEASLLLTKLDGFPHAVENMDDMFSHGQIAPDSCALKTKLTFRATNFMVTGVLRLLTPWFESYLAHEVATKACSGLLTLQETLNTGTPVERSTLTITKKTSAHDWLLHWLEELDVDVLPLLCPTNSVAIAHDSLCTSDGHMLITHTLIKKVARSVSHASTKMLLHLTRYVELRRMRLFDVTFAPVNSTDGDGKWLSTTRYRNGATQGLRIAIRNLALRMEVNMDYATEVLVKLKKQNVTMSMLLRNISFTTEITPYSEPIDPRIPTFPQRVAILDNCTVDIEVDFDFTQAGWLLRTLGKGTHILPGLERLIHEELQKTVCRMIRAYATEITGMLNTTVDHIVEKLPLLDREPGVEVTLSPEEIQRVYTALDATTKRTRADVQLEGGNATHYYLSRGAQLLYPSLAQFGHYANGTTAHTVLFDRPVSDIRSSDLLDLSRSGIAEVLNLTSRAFGDPRSPFYIPTVFANGTATFNVTSKQSRTSIEYPGVGMLTLGISEIALAGLNTITDLHLLDIQPGGIASRSALRMAHVEVRVRIDVSVEAWARRTALLAIPTLESYPLEVHVSLDDTILDLYTVVLAHQRKMERATEGLNATCVARAVGQSTGNKVAAQLSFANFTTARPHFAIRHLRHAIDGSGMVTRPLLDTQLFTLVDTLFQYGVSAVGTSLPELLRVLSLSLARAATNKIAHYIEAARHAAHTTLDCATLGPPMPLLTHIPPAAAKRAIRWGEAAFVTNTTQHIVNRLLSYDKVNKFFGALAPTGVLDVVQFFPALTQSIHLGPQWNLHFKSARLLGANIFTNLTVPLIAPNSSAIGARVEVAPCGVTLLASLQMPMCTHPVELQLEVNFRGIAARAGLYTWLDKDKVGVLAASDMHHFHNVKDLLEAMALVDVPTPFEFGDTLVLVKLESIIVRMDECAPLTDSEVRVPTRSRLPLVYKVHFDTTSSNIVQATLAIAARSRLTSWVNMHLKAAYRDFMQPPYKSPAPTTKEPKKQDPKLLGVLKEVRYLRETEEQISESDEEMIDLRDLSVAIFVESWIRSVLSVNALNDLVRATSVVGNGYQWGAPDLMNPWLDMVTSIVNRGAPPRARMDAAIRGLEINGLQRDPFDVSSYLFRILNATHVGVNITLHNITLGVNARYRDASLPKTNVNVTWSVSRLVLHAAVDIRIPTADWPAIRAMRGTSFFQTACSAKYIRVASICADVVLDDVTVSSVNRNVRVRIVEHVDRVSQHLVSVVVKGMAQVHVRALLNKMLDPHPGSVCNPQTVPPRVYTPTTWNDTRNFRWGRVDALQWMNTLVDDVLGVDDPAPFDDYFSLNYFLKFPYNRKRIMMLPTFSGNVTVLERAKSMDQRAVVAPRVSLYWNIGSSALYSLAEVGRFTLQGLKQVTITNDNAHNISFLVDAMDDVAWVVTSDVPAFGLHAGNELIQIHVHATNEWITSTTVETRAQERATELKVFLKHPSNRPYTLSFVMPWQSSLALHIDDAPAVSVDLTRIDVEQLNDTLKTFHSPLRPSEEDIVIRNAPECVPAHACTSYAYAHVVSPDRRVITLQRPTLVDGGWSTFGTVHSDTLEFLDVQPRTAFIVSNCNVPAANGIYTGTVTSFTNGVGWFFSMHSERRRNVTRKMWTLQGQYHGIKHTFASSPIMVPCDDACAPADVLWGDFEVKSISATRRSFLVDVAQHCRINFTIDSRANVSSVSVSLRRRVVAKTGLGDRIGGFQLLHRAQERVIVIAALVQRANATWSTTFLTKVALPNGRMFAVPRVVISSNRTAVAVRRSASLQPVALDSIGSIDSTIGFRTSLAALDMHVHAAINYHVDTNIFVDATSSRVAIDLRVPLSDVDVDVGAIAEIAQRIVTRTEAQLQDPACVLSHVGAQTRLQTVLLSAWWHSITLGVNARPTEFLIMDNDRSLLTVDIRPGRNPRTVALKCRGTYHFVSAHAHYEHHAQDGTKCVLDAGTHTLTVVRTETVPKVQTMSLSDAGLDLLSRSIPQQFQDYLLHAFNVYAMQENIIPFVNAHIDRVVRNSSLTCARPAWAPFSPRVSDVGRYLFIGMLLFGTFLWLAEATDFDHFRASWPARRTLASAGSRDARAVSRLSAKLIPAGSLGAQPLVPPLAGIALPCWIIATICGFMSSNSSIGATVNVELSTGDGIVMQNATLPHIFDFTLLGTMSDMWHAGVYPLALLIGIFSGILPYVKCLILLLCWVATPAQLDLQTRGRMLTVIDVAGKWSLVDSFVMVIFMVAFRMHITLPSQPSTNPNAKIAVIDIIVSPEYGFYSFLVATILSLVLGHIVVSYHRKAEQADLAEKVTDVTTDVTDFVAATTMVRLADDGARLSARRPSAGSILSVGKRESVASAKGCKMPRVDAFSLSTYNKGLARAYGDFIDTAGHSSSRDEGKDEDSNVGSEGVSARSVDEAYLDGAKDPWWSMRAHAYVSQHNVVDAERRVDCDLRVRRHTSTLAALRRTVSFSVFHLKYKVSHTKQQFQVYWERYVQVETHVVPLLLVAALVMLGFTATIDSVGMQYSGLTGWLLSDTQLPSKEIMFSLVHLGRSVSAASTVRSADPVSFGIYAIQATYFIFAMVGTIVLLLLLLVIWVAPVRRACWACLATVIHVLEAWSAIDVFAISVFAGVAEIGQLTSFIVGNKCDLLNTALVQLFEDQFVPKCVDISSNFIWGSWFLLFTSIIVFFIARRVIFLASAAVGTTALTAVDNADTASVRSDRSVHHQSDKSVVPMRGVCHTHARRACLQHTMDTPFFPLNDEVPTFPSVSVSPWRDDMNFEASSYAASDLGKKLLPECDVSTGHAAT